MKWRPLRPSFALLFLLSILSTASAAAQEATTDTLLPALLRQNQHTMAISEGRLTGAGAELLLDEGRRAHFLVIGETHGVAEVPELAGALFRALRPHGYAHLVIETSPAMATLLDGLARGGRDALNELFQRHPLGVPFYNWHEAAALLVEAVEAAGPEPVLWGVDYDFVLSAPLWLEVLERRAATPDGRAVVAGYRARAEAGERALLEQGSPATLFLATATADDYDALRSAVAGDPEAVAIVDWLEASGEVWRLQFTGRNYESNRARTDLMRRALAGHYRRADRDGAPPPRALFKFGANHAFRGHTPMNVLDVGTMAAMLAEHAGGHAFNLLAVAGPGTRHTVFDPRGARVAPFEAPGWMAPFQEAADVERWTLFDLRPLRPHLAAGRLTLHPEVARVVWGFDALLVLVGSRPAGFDPPPHR